MNDLGDSVVGFEIFNTRLDVLDSTLKIIEKEVSNLEGYLEEVTRLLRQGSSIENIITQFYKRFSDLQGLIQVSQRDLEDLSLEIELGNLEERQKQNLLSRCLVLNNGFQNSDRILVALKSQLDKTDFLSLTPANPRMKQGKKGKVKKIVFPTIARLLIPLMPFILVVTVVCFLLFLALGVIKSVTEFLNISPSYTNQIQNNIKNVV